MPSCLLQDIPAVEFKLPASHRVVQFDRWLSWLVSVDDPIDPRPEAGNVPFGVLSEKMINLPALKLRQERFSDEGGEVFVPGVF